jgi:hypothetical protein
MSSGLTKKKTKQKGAGEGRAMEMSALTQNEKQKRTENSTEQKQKGIERNKLLKSNRNACPRFFNATRSLYTRREITPRGFTSTHRNKFEFQKSVYHVRRDRTTWYIQYVREKSRQTVGPGGGRRPIATSFSCLSVYIRNPHISS